MSTIGKAANDRTLRWFLSFLFFILLFYFLSRDPLIVSHLNRVVALFQLRVTSLLLSLLGFVHEVKGAAILTPERRFVVAESCSGLFVFFLLEAAVLSFPASKWAKLEGIVGGAAALIGLNIFRIMMIVTLASRFPDTFGMLHIVVGQVVVIAGMMGFFLLWLGRAGRGGPMNYDLFKKGLFRAFLLFIGGYLLGYFLYGLFLKSSLGGMVSGLVQAHTYVVLNLSRELFDAFFQGYRVPSVRFNAGCLSSPMMVLFFGILTAWPCSWKKKVLIALGGFVPVFYIYHLVRALATAFSFLPGATKANNVIYNCYGQFVLAIVGMACCLSHQRSGGRWGAGRRWLSSILAGVAAGTVASLVGGKMTMGYVLPGVLKLIFHGSIEYYDPQMTIATMAYLQFFIYYFLVWSAPGEVAGKWVPAGVGSLVILPLVPVGVVVNEILGFSPHVGLLKLAVVGFPFLLHLMLSRWYRPENRLPVTADPQAIGGQYGDAP